jgi:UDP-glucose 4-epimerase
MELSKSKILITGASGFIGQHLARELATKGAKLHGVVPWTHDGPENLDRCWQADLTRFEETQRIIRDSQPDIIYHLCSLANGARNMDLVLPTLRNEILSTVNVLITATEMGCKRLIMAGSLEEPMPGETPSSPYAAAKAASRSYGQMFHKLYGTPVVFTRIFMTYGPGQPDWKVIPYCVQSLLSGLKPTIGSADRLVDWIYISDVIGGLAMIAETPNLEGESLDLGSGTLVKIADIVKRIQQLIDSTMPVEFDALAARIFEQVRCADVATTFAKMGWRPKVSLDQGLRITVDRLRERFCNASASFGLHARYGRTG